MIHYHGTRMSGDDTVAVRALQGRHAFVSLSDISQLELAAEVCQSFALDNGAFSVWKAGAEYDPMVFADLVEKWHRHPGFDFYVMPDVIDGDHNDNCRMRSTWNKRVSSEIWHKGAPVWHLHEPIDVLREMCNSFARVCLGSSGQYSDPGSGQWWSRIAQAMEAATNEEGLPLCKLHGLRMLDPTIFSHLPLASADSTNVARNIGIDSKWKGTYLPRSREVRAAILMERIEAHASASRWSGSGVGAQPNLELFG